MKKSDPRLSGLNIILIGIISTLYILMVTKIAEIISSGYDEPDTQVSVYVAVIYLLSIVGMILVYMKLSENKSPETKTPNWILKWSINIGGIILLIYTIINYWDYMSNIAKLSLITLSISSIIYYVYKYYE